MTSDPHDVPRSKINSGCLISAGIALIIFAVVVILGATSAIPAARRNGCTCHMAQLGVAIQNYHDVYKTFPPAYIADAKGKPLLSWRVLILPFMEEQAFYNQVHFDEPWDSPHNRSIAKQFDSSIYCCPAAVRNTNETGYVAVVGPQTAWPGEKPVKISEVRDGTSKTIFVVEIADSGIHWMEPRDLSFDQALQGINPKVTGPRISSHHNGGVMALWGDAHVSFLADDVPIETLRALLTRDGGEQVSEPGTP